MKHDHVQKSPPLDPILSCPPTSLAGNEARFAAEQRTAEQAYRLKGLRLAVVPLALLDRLINHQS
jgi:hypothetical protein